MYLFQTWRFETFDRYVIGLILHPLFLLIFNNYSVMHKTVLLSSCSFFFYLDRFLFLVLSNFLFIILPTRFSLSLPKRWQTVSSFLLHI